MPRKHSETYDIKADMREDLLACYREVAPGCLTQHGAFRKTVKHPAKRYYVTARQAYTRILDYINRKSTPEQDFRKEHHVRMWRSLLEAFFRVMNRPKMVGKSIKEIVDAAVLEPAPEFFVTPEYMRNIFSYTRLGFYDEDGRLIAQATKDRDKYYETHPKPKNRWNRK